MSDNDLVMFYLSVLIPYPYFWKSDFTYDVCGPTRGVQNIFGTFLLVFLFVLDLESLLVLNFNCSWIGDWWPSRHWWLKIWKLVRTMKMMMMMKSSVCPQCKLWHPPTTLLPWGVVGCCRAFVASNRPITDRPWPPAVQPTNGKPAAATPAGLLSTSPCCIP